MYGKYDASTNRNVFKALFKAEIFIQMIARPQRAPRLYGRNRFPDIFHWLASGKAGRFFKSSPRLTFHLHSSEI